MSKPGIDQLLIDSALDPDLCRRLRESPDEVFGGFDLTAEEREILRSPDHRLLALFGAALARQAAPAAGAPAAVVEPASDPPQAKTLPEIRLGLAVVPCAQYNAGEFAGFRYAVWVNALQPGADPATLPPPAGSVLPGQPLAPLHAVVNVSMVQLPDVGGQPRVGMWATMRQASNISATPRLESDLRSEPVRGAVTAVRAADAGERYDRLLDLVRALDSGDVR